MSKIKLVKRSENVNYIYSDNGEKTPHLNGVSYKVVDTENDMEVGSVDCMTGSFNISFYGGIDSVDKSAEIVEKMFAALAQ